MVILNLALFALTTAAASLPSESAPLLRRQFGFGKGDSTSKPVSIKDVPPKLDQNARRQIIRWGPYQLQPAGAKKPWYVLDSAAGDSFAGQLDGICRECMFLSGSTYLTYENETQADVATGVYNHHVAIWDTGKASKAPFACTFSGGNLNGATVFGPFGSGGKGNEQAKGSAGAMGGGMAGMGSGAAAAPPAPKPAAQKRQVGALPGMSMLFGSGDDGVARSYYATVGDSKTGFYLGKSDTLYHTSEFVNYRNFSQTVYITADYEWVPGKPAGYMDSQMGGLSATGCMGNRYYPTKDARHVVSSPPYDVTAPGYLFNMHAHLHDGGVGVVLKKNGDTICESNAIYGGDKGTTSVGGEKWETIQDYTHCDKPVEVKVGDKIVLESIYDTSAHRLRPGASNPSMGAEAMGMISYTFASK